MAAENFYGDIVKQLGGNHVAVTSVLTDPNVDPHEYQTNPQQAMLVGRAKLVIENGGGYDDWMDKLVAATPNDKRITLKAIDAAKIKLPDNEHVWYSIDNASAIADDIIENLKRLDAVHANDYEKNLRTFKQSLQPIQQKIHEIQEKYHGTPIALTETIYLYQTGPLGLRVMTPLEFQKAVAEGEDPPANAMITADDQIKKRAVKLLIDNLQTSSQMTMKLQNDARSQRIPVVLITETMPSEKTYQSWMLGQLNTLEQALRGNM